MSGTGSSNALIFAGVLGPESPSIWIGSPTGSMISTSVAGKIVTSGRVGNRPLNNAME